MSNSEIPSNVADKHAEDARVEDTRVEDTRVAQMHKVAADAKELLKAISGPYRLMILCLLLGGEKNVTEICEALDVRQSLVSQHMALLRHMGLVNHDRRGHYVYYSIADATTKEIILALHKRYCAAEQDRDAA